MKYCFYFFIFLAPTLNAEFLLLERVNNTFQPVSYDAADDVKKNILTNIYENILNRYQFPMLINHYENLTDANKKIVQKTLAIPSKHRIPSKDLINLVLKKNFKKRFKVHYIPQVIFELILLKLSFDDLLRVTRTGLAQKKQIFSNCLDESLSLSLKNSLFKFCDSKNKPDQFLMDAYSKRINQRCIRELYFRASYEFLINFYDCSKEQYNLSFYRSVIMQLAQDLQKRVEQLASFKSDNLDLLYKLGLRYVANNHNNISNPKIINILSNLADAEFYYIKKNKFILINIFSHHLGLEHYLNRSVIDVGKEYFLPLPFFFSNSILSGKPLDSSFAFYNEPHRLFDDLLIGRHFFYLLPIDMFNYIKKNSIYEWLFIAPINTTFGFLSNSEFTHSRTKISFVDPYKKCTPNLFKLVKKSKILLLDNSLGIKAFTNYERFYSSLLKKSFSYISRKAQYLEYGDKYDVERKKIFEKYVEKTNLLASRNKIIGKKHCIVEKKIPLFKKDTRAHKKESILYKIAQDKKLASTPVHILRKGIGVSFEDIRKQAKIHSLVVPKKAFLSLPHFVSNASNEEVGEILRLIAATADRLAVSKSGYRMVTNHAFRPGVYDDFNHAKQEESHLHFHIGGGESLGKVATIGSESPLISDFNSIMWSNVSSKKIFNALMKEHCFLKINFQNYVLVAYEIPPHLQGVKHPIKKFIGFTIVNHSGTQVFSSFHDFASNASNNLIAHLLKLVVYVAQKEGIEKTGYRFIANSGPNAWQNPKGVFQVFIVGGEELGFTLQNAHGNHPNRFSIIRKDDKLKCITRIDKRYAYDYTDLIYEPHSNNYKNLVCSLYLVKKNRRNFLDRFKNRLVSFHDGKVEAQY